MSAYKCIYTEINHKPGETGMLVERARGFKTFHEAVNFVRDLRITNANMTGMPVIEIKEGE